MIMALEKQISSRNNKDNDCYDNNTPSSAITAASALSRSVPGSRRNSNDESKRSLFDTTTNNTQFDSPIDFFVNQTPPPPSRSFSIDVGSMHHKNRNNYTTTSHSNSSLFFDDNITDASVVPSPSFHHYLHSSRYNGSLLNNNNPQLPASYGLFTSSTATTTAAATSDHLDLESSLRKNSTRSVESLQSESWAQLLDTTSTQQQQSSYYPISPGPLDNNTTDVQAAFYGQPVAARRFSHGWVNNNNNNNNSFQQHHQHQLPIPKSRLTASYSYSDLHMVAALGSYRMSTNNNNEICQHFRQYGYCTLKDTCPYSHEAPPPPLLRYSNSTSTVDTENNNNRKQNNDDKFAGLQLEEFQGKLYDLCKDQHGCRFLQLKLEESQHNVTIIYQEIHIHFVELMTDPFGNYLCQKLLECCDDTQRSNIVDVIAPEFLKICQSMHGTRAVQKLIGFLSTKLQIQAVIVALEPNVVALIKDLNGNHVIQKCLHKLSPENNQFIYDIVSQHCIEVSSHKHGCCVYQRCIDHAVQSQKNQLVNVITQNALPLVQDPFGNYVVQYVLELGDATYSDNLIKRFIEPIRELSVQKFSSNVIEKCIRVAERDTRRLLIAGITNHPDMDRFLRDSYANYVIQTCLDFAEQDQRNQFIECIRPLLPSIRNTPYGKRIYSKIHNTTTKPRSRMVMVDTSSLISGINTLGLNDNNNSNNDTSVYI